ncbi:NAD kinase [Mariniluteicoccus endophyticus]
MTSPNPDETVHHGRRVAVLTHIHRPEAVEAARRFVASLTSEDITVLMPRFDIDQMGDVPQARSLEDHGAGPIELAVVFGGDGTILRAAEWVLARDIPMLGVNLGHVGFLAEAESHEIDQVVDQVIARSWTVEERLTARVRVFDGPGGDPVWESYAVNEVSIEKAARERMLEVVVAIDDRPLSRWGCDGVLVATPTGSTAYAFSAGGPVMWPGVEALLVVPISAHALFARPMVISPRTSVRVRLLESTDAHGVVWCDGRRSFDLSAPMEIEVDMHTHPLRLARLSPAPFTDRLVRKFGLRVEGWRGAAESTVGQEAP